MHARLFRVGRYGALLAARGLTDPNPALPRLVATLEDYLDGGDLDETEVEAAIAAIEAGAAPEVWAASAEEGAVRKARVVPSPLEVRFVVGQLKRG